MIEGYRTESRRKMEEADGGGRWRRDGGGRSRRQMEEVDGEGRSIRQVEEADDERRSRTQLNDIGRGSRSSQYD
jgi:hypothetical protein